MDYEKKYKEALERAKVWYNDKFTVKKEKALLKYLFPKLAESEDERIRKELLDYLGERRVVETLTDTRVREEWVAWLEKQGKQKHTCANCKKFEYLHQNCPYSPIYRYTNLTEAKKHLNDETHCAFWIKKQDEQKRVESELFEIEHGKYYYCIKDYYSGGNKRASKGDVVQALRGMAMMTLDDRASEYFLPVNHIEHNPAWSEEDEKYINDLTNYFKCDSCLQHEEDDVINWLKSLKNRVQPHWKPTEEQMEAFYWMKQYPAGEFAKKGILNSLYNDLKKL